MAETIADRAEFENINEQIDKEALFRSLKFFEEETNFGIGSENPGKSEIIVEYTGKETVMPVPEELLREKFESYGNIIRYIEDLVNKESTSEAEKIENEEYFPHVKAAEPEKFTLQLIEKQDKNSGKFILLIEGDLIPLDRYHGFEIMIILQWNSPKIDHEISELKKINSVT